MSSEPTHPPPDHELETFLDGSSRIGAAYREARRADTAPLELDAAILAAARQTAAEARRRPPRWLQPLALAATLMLSLGVLLSLWRSPSQRARLTPQLDAPIPAMSAASKASVLDGDARHEDAPMASMAPPLPTPAPMQAPRDDVEFPEHRAKQASKVMPSDSASAPVPAAAADAAAVAPAPPPQAPAAEVRPDRASSSADAPGTAASDATDERKAESARAPAPAAGAAAATMAPVLEPDAMTQDFFQRVRTLQQAGEAAQARAALQAFVREHPGTVLPDDLRALMDARTAP